MLIVIIGQLEAARSYLGNPGFLKDYPTTSSSRPSDSSIYDCGLGNSNTSSPNSSGTRPDSTALESNKRQSSVSSGTSSPKRSPQLDHKTPPQKRMKLGEQGQAPCLRCRMLKKKVSCLIPTVSPLANSGSLVRLPSTLYSLPSTKL